MRKIFLTLIYLSVILLCQSAWAFDVKFVNDTSKLMLYRLIWIDCDWEMCKGNPAYMAVGEIKADTESTIGVDYPAGWWAVTWEEKVNGFWVDYSKYEIIITERLGLLTCSPDKEPEFNRGI